MKLCIPIKEKNPEKILQLIHQAKNKKANIVEIWLDQISDFCNEKIFSEKNKKILKKILNCTDIQKLCVLKDLSEKGNFCGSPTQKLKILSECAKENTAFCDFCEDTPDDILKKFCDTKKNTKLIISAHFWDHTPTLEELKKLSKKFLSKGADIVKIATTPKNKKDVDIIFRLDEFLTKEKIPHIVLSMKEIGKKTRFLKNNEFMFVSMKTKTAPGQINIDYFRAYKNLL